MPAGGALWVSGPSQPLTLSVTSSKFADNMLENVTSEGSTSRIFLGSFVSNEIFSGSLQFLLATTRLMSPPPLSFLSSAF